MTATDEMFLFRKDSAYLMTLPDESGTGPAEIAGTHQLPGICTKTAKGDPVDMIYQLMTAGEIGEQVKNGVDCKIKGRMTS